MLSAFTPLPPSRGPLATRARLLVLAAVMSAPMLPAFSSPADAQIYVYPRRPNQSNVRYFDFEWQHVDILVGPGADTSDADSFSPGRTLEHRAATLGQSVDRFVPGRSIYDPYYLYSQKAGSVPHAHLGGGDRGALVGPSTLAAEAPSSVLASGEESANQDGAGEEAQSGALEAPMPPVTGEPATPPVAPRTAPPATVAPEQGGVRLYFYEREHEIAERAAAFISESYTYLVEAFNHVPSRTLPYVLYNSYQEFLQTNIFPIQEGVLGVTGRRDLQLVLPYFGDHRMFQHVSTHEMVHQFTIQKALDVAREAGVSGDPLDQVPLWFIEGIAEFYAHRGLDPETEMMARDLLLNPDPMRGYVMLDFFEDRPFSGLWTYKIGQVRVAFLEEVYGAGTLQRILEESPRLLPARKDRRAPISFRALLTRITGDDARTLSGRFETWLKRRSYTSFLRSMQDSPDVIFLNDFEGILQTMASSPTGQVLMYRSINPQTGRVNLWVFDARAPGLHRLIAGDGVPGVESLHPVGGRTFDVREDRLVFVARADGRDVLYVQDLRHSATRRTADGNGNGSADAIANGEAAPGAEGAEQGAEERGAWNVQLALGKRTEYRIGQRGLMAAESPAFSPDGRKIAFVGLDEHGQKDLYLFEPLERDDYVLTRLTDDEYAERGVSWGPAGIVYASDATGHGRYNLFRLDPMAAGQPERLTFEARDHFDARAMPDGRLMFSSFDRGRANLYELVDGHTVRHTDIVTGLFDIGPGPGNSVWALFHHRGQRQPVRIPTRRFLAMAVETPSTDVAPEPLPSRSIDGATPYDALSLRNWEINNIFGVFGASSAGIFGQLVLLTNDRLRNHAMFLNVLAYGSFENTVANLLYLNQESRLIWGTGLFQDVRYRVDDTLATDRFLTAERFYGAQGSLRYPLNRFLYLQGDLAIGGVSFFLPEGSLNFLRNEEERNPGERFVDPWRAANAGTRFQTSPSLSLGYNTIRYHPETGPIAGNSLLLETTLDIQPFDGETHGNVRLDGEQYFPIYGRVNISLRGGVGTSYGGPLSRQFFLSSFDTLRGVEFGDTRFLLGHRFFFSKLELRFPLNFLVRLPIIDLEGVAGADFGAAGDSLTHIWDHRALGLVTGLNFGLGPLVFRLHFAKPLDIGAVALPNDGDWVTNFSLGWRYW